MMFEINGTPLQMFVSACLYLGQMGIGFTTSWSAPNIVKLQNPEESPLAFVLSDTQASFVASLLFVGAFPGPYIVGWLSNVKGRKPCLLLGGVLGVIGYTLMAVTRSLSMLYCGRLITGLSIGCIGPMILVYVGEIASTNIRGVLLTVVGIFTTCGSMLLFSISPFLSYHTTIYIAMALFTIFTLYASIVPESPMYYVLKGNDDRLRKILQDLGRVKDFDKLVASERKNRIISNIRDWKDLFTVPTGSSIDGNIAMIIIACFQLFGSGLTPIFIEKVGRKKLLSVSCATCSITMLIMGIYFYLVYARNPMINSIKWLPLVTLIIFFILYDFGIGVIPNVLIGEMFTLNTRSNGSAIAMTTAWVSGFLVTTAFGVMVNVGTFVPFLIFSGTSAIAFLFSVFVIPETKGKSLLEIQDSLGKT